jgi:hypothetical protein
MRTATASKERTEPGHPIASRVASAHLAIAAGLALARVRALAYEDVGRGTGSDLRSVARSRCCLPRTRLPG